jgi:hypothetical protein
MEDKITIQDLTPPKAEEVKAIDLSSYQQEFTTYMRQVVEESERNSVLAIHSASHIVINF